MAVIAGDSSRSVDGDEISVARDERVGIIMAVVAGYAAVNKGRFCRRCPMAFLTRDVAVYGMGLMGDPVACQAIGSSVNVRFDAHCLWYKRLLRHVAAFTDLP